MNDGPVLYGVGVGPGAPDLMTLRAVRVLRSVAVVAAPRRNNTAASLAWSIAEAEVGPVEGQERLLLTFPMTKDPEVLRPAWEAALEQVGQRLAAGLSVAFVTEGDPLVYSTFIYMMDEVRQRWPQVRIEVVPGITSLTAVPAVAQIPLADGQETMAVLPASYSVEELGQVLDQFDTTILMKVGNRMAEVVDVLRSKGLLSRAVYVSRATMDNQRIERDLETLTESRCDYFSMVVVRKGDRSGVLMGQGTNPPAEAYAGS